MSNPCDRAAAISTAKDLDSGKLEAATDKISNCMSANWSTNYNEMINFAAIVKETEKKGVGFDVKLHIRASINSKGYVYGLPELEIE